VREAARRGSKPASSPDPRSYTPKHLAEKILTSRSALEGERKQVTVLFADVKGSMDLAEQVDAEEWHRIMNRFFAILSEGVHRFEGTINQYTGDGIMALFGAPIAHEDHAQRACFSAVSLKEDLRRYAEGLRSEKDIDFSVRIGLHSGEVVVGKIGDDLRMDYTALGHTASLGARMEQIAAPGKAYLTEDTAKLVEGMFALDKVGRVPVKGVKELVGVYELVGVGQLRTKLEVSQARGFSRFVGREEEMVVLQSAFGKALEGRGQIVAVVGEAGVGKSRLCLEFIERCRERGILVNQGHCLAHGKAIPFAPVLELWRSYFGITEVDAGEQARGKIAGTLELLGEDFTDVLPLVFEFLGVADSARPAPQIDPQQKQRRMAQFLRRVVRLQSARAPMVVVVDDLHWIDQASDEVVGQFAEAIEGARAMFLVNFRQDYEAPWMRRSHYEQLPLLPLGREGTEAMLEDLLGSDPSIEELKERLRERTGGNPFFIEEIVQSLTESGALEGARGGRRMVRPLEAVSVPPTVHVVLAARIDRLPEREKALLQTASVIGKRFSEEVLKKVTGLAETDVATALSTLDRRDFVHQVSLYPEVEWAFKHPLTQEAAYRSQLSERRKELHAAVARGIQDSNPNKLDERASEIAYHREQAGEALEAARWYLRAARSTDRNRSPMVVVRHLRKVHELVQQVGRSSEAADVDLSACEGLLNLANAANFTAEEARTLYSAGKDLAARREDLRALARLNAFYAQFLGAHGSPEESVRYGEEAVALAERLQDSWLKLWTSLGLSRACISAGRLQRGLSIAEAGLESSEALGQTPAPAGYPPSGIFGGWMSFWKGEFLRLLGRLKEAEGSFDRAIAFGRRNGHLLLLAISHSAASALYWHLADFGPMLAHAREAVQAAEGSEAPMFISVSYNRLGLALLMSRAYRDALAAFEKALAQGDLEWRPFNLTGIATTYLALRDGEKALKAVREAENAARQSPDLYADFYNALTLAEILLSTRGVGAREDTESALQTAAGAAAKLGARVLEPDLLVRRARLAQVLRDEDRYRREIAEARRLLTEMGATERAVLVEQEVDFFSMRSGSQAGRVKNPAG
jgi:class 3 adenylate cyclase